ncbi:MAG: hypothetical protein MZU79_02650 [Anaerotruncus sp.]|nr:hypothetical protein [Anaerotruncus sp.]
MFDTLFHRQIAGDRRIDAPGEHQQSSAGDAGRIPAHAGFLPDEQISSIIDGFRRTARLRDRGHRR